MTCIDPSQVMESAARCSGVTIEQARALLVLGAEAALVPLIAFAVVLAVWMGRR